VSFIPRKNLLIHGKPTKNLEIKSFKYADVKSNLRLSLGFSTLKSEGPHKGVGADSILAV